MYQIVGLDFDQTLVPVQHLYNRASWMCGCIITEALGENGISPHDLLETEKDIDRKLMQEMEFDVRRFPQSWLTTYQRLARERHLRVSPAVTERLLKAARSFKDGPFRPYPGVPEALHQLRKRGKKLVIITAGRRAEALQWHKLRSAGLQDLVDDFQITPEDKTEKMKEVFNGGRRSGIMVGDSLKHDIEPAHKLGIATVLVTTSTWDYTDADVRPTHTIKQFTKFPQLLWRIEHHRGT